MAESSVDSYINAQPEQAMDWNAFYNNYGREKYGDAWVDMDPDHWFTKVGNFFTGDVNVAKNRYEAYLNNLDKRNEFLAVQSARAYDKMMDDSKIQRSLKDYEAAGLNPYLLLNNGSIASGTAPTSAKADYSHKKYKTEEKSNKGRDIALLLIGVARLAAALL